MLSSRVGNLADAGTTPLTGGFPGYEPLTGGNPAFVGHQDFFADLIHPNDVSYEVLAEHAINEFYGAWLTPAPIPSMQWPGLTALALAISRNSLITSFAAAGTPRGSGQGSGGGPD